MHSLFRPTLIDPSIRATAAPAWEQSDDRPGMNHGTDELHALRPGNIEHQHGQQQRRQHLEQQQHQQYQSGHNSSITDGLWHMQAGNALQPPAVLQPAPDWQGAAVEPASPDMAASPTAAADAATAASYAHNAASPNDMRQRGSKSTHPAASSGSTHAPAEVMALALPCSCTFASGGHSSGLPRHSAAAMGEEVEGPSRRRGRRRRAAASAVASEVSRSDPPSHAVAYLCFCHEGEGEGEGGGLHCWCEPVTSAVTALTAPGVPVNAAATSNAVALIAAGGFMPSVAAAGAGVGAGGSTPGTAPAEGQQERVEGRAHQGEVWGHDDVVADGDADADARQWQRTVQGGVELGAWMFLLYAAQAVGLQSASADDASVILALSVRGTDGGASLTRHAHNTRQYPVCVVHIPVPASSPTALPPLPSLPGGCRRFLLGSAQSPSHSRPLHYR